MYLIFIIEFASLLMALIIALIRRKNTGLHPIRFFLITSLIYTIIFLFPNPAAKPNFHKVLMNFVSLLDVTNFYFYFSRLMTGKILRLLLLLSYFLILSISVYYLIIRPDGLTHFNAVFYGIENLFITIPCILYLYSLFHSDDDNDLKANPHFIATCGILFFYATTFPFYITYKTVLDVTSEMTLIFVGINTLLNSILFITFMKAFLCPYPEQR